MESYPLFEYLDKYKLTKELKFGKIDYPRPLYITKEYLLIYPTKKLRNIFISIVLLIPTISYIFYLFILILTSSNRSNLMEKIEISIPGIIILYLFSIIVLVPIKIFINPKKSIEWKIEKSRINQILFEIKNEDKDFVKQTYPSSIMRNLYVEKSNKKYRFNFIKDLHELKIDLPYTNRTHDAMTFLLLTGKKKELEIIKDIFNQWSLFEA